MTTLQILARGLTVFARGLLPSAGIGLAALLIYAPAWAFGNFVLPGIPGGPASQFLVLALLGTLSFFELIPMGALLSLYADIAQDTPRPFLAALTTGLRRILSLLAVVVASVAVMFGFFVVVFATVFGLSVAFRSLAQGPALALAIGLGVPLAIVAIAAYAFIYITITVAMSASVHEGAGPIASFVAAIARCLTRGQRARALWVGIVSVVPLQVAGFVFVYSAGPTYFWTIAAVVAFAAQVALFLLGYAWITVYSLEAKARLER
jgi:hypothetical protein